MHITILAGGSLGDVQPYVALGAGLRAAGHHVRLATFDSFRPLVESHGLDFAPLTNPTAAVTGSAAWRAWQQSGDNPVRYVFHFFRVARLARPALLEMLAGCWHAAHGASAILSSATGVAGPHVAARLGLPHAWALLQPMSYTRAFPHFLAPPWRLGGAYAAVTYQAAGLIYWWLFKGAVNHWRAATLGLPPRARPGPAGIAAAASRLVLYGFSPAVVPRPADWPDHVQATGYWFLDQAAGWRPSPSLLDFLSAGSPPVYLALDALAGRHPARALDLALAALDQAGRRGLLYAGWSTLDRPLPPGVFQVERTPHRWLFHWVAAAIHHGGAGTTASVLRAGIPSLVAPRFFDQPFWGRRVAALGAGPPPIRPPQLTVGRLSAAIVQMAGDEAMRSRARHLGRQLQAEDGVGRAVEIFHRYLA